jgi:hypothetical protein
VISGIATATVRLVWHMWAFAALMFAAVIGQHRAHLQLQARLSHPLRDDVICIEGLRTQGLNRLAANRYDSNNSLSRDGRRPGGTMV